MGGLVIQLVSGSQAFEIPILGAVKPWQMVFFVVGLPGVLVALLMLTVNEPARRGKVAGHEHGLPLGLVLEYVKQHRRLFIAHFCGFAMLAVPITTILTWVPAYYNRVLGFSRPEVGLTLGAILVILSPAGVYFGGLARRYGCRKRVMPMRRFASASAQRLVLLPLSYLATSGANPDVALYLFGPFVFCASISMAVAPAALQIVTPNQMREADLGYMDARSESRDGGNRPDGRGIYHGICIA